MTKLAIFTARRCASAVYAVIVCLSVCPSQVGVLQRRLDLGSHKQRHTIARGFYVLDTKNLGEIPTTSSSRGSQIEVG